MNMERERQKILEVLSWIKEKGLWPRTFGSGDLFIDPITNRLISWGRLRESQRAYALWVPNPSTMKKILKRYGITLSMMERDGVFFAGISSDSGKVVAVGVGANEAVISLLNRLKLRPALVV